MSTYLLGKIADNLKLDYFSYEKNGIKANITVVSLTSEEKQHFAHSLYKSIGFWGYYPLPIDFDGYLPNVKGANLVFLSLQ